FTNNAHALVQGQPVPIRETLVAYRLYDEEFCGADPEERRMLVDLALVYTEKPLPIDSGFFMPISNRPADLDNRDQAIVGFGMSDQSPNGGEKIVAYLEELVQRCTADNEAVGCQPDYELFVVNTPDEYRDTCPG